MRQISYSSSENPLPYYQFVVHKQAETTDLGELSTECGLYNFKNSLFLLWQQCYNICMNRDSKHFSILHFTKQHSLSTHFASLLQHIKTNTIYSLSAQTGLAMCVKRENRVTTKEATMLGTQASDICND